MSDFGVGDSRLLEHDERKRKLEAWTQGPGKVRPEDIERPPEMRDNSPPVRRHTANPHLPAATDPPQQQGPRPSEPPLPPREEPPAQEEFVRPPPQFSPSLFQALPQNDSEFDAWARQATSEVTAYLNGLDTAYLGFMAEQGRLDDYMLEQLQNTDEADHAARLQLASEMMPFAGPRTPQLKSLIGQELMVAGRRPELSGQLAPIQQQWDVDRTVERRTTESGAKLQDTLSRAIVAEGQRGFLDRYVAGPAEEAARGVLLQPEAGGPEHRIMSAVMKHADQFGGDLRGELQKMGLPAEKAAARSEQARTSLLLEGYERAEEELRKSGVDEGAIEWFMRKTAHFVGFPVGAGMGKGIGQRLGKLIGSVVGSRGNLVQAAAKAVAAGSRPLSKTARAANFLAGGAGIYGWAQFFGPGPAFEPELAKLEGEERERASEAASHMNGLMATVLLPVLHYSHLVGRAGTIGLTTKIPGKATQFAVESTVGFEPTAEAANEVVNAVRRGLMALQKDDPGRVKSALELTFQAFPDAPGRIERISQALAAGDDAALKSTVREYAADFLPTLAGFGAVVAIGAIRPAALRRSDINQARKEVRAVLDPESQKVAERAIDEIAAKATKPTAAEMVAEKGEPAARAAKVAGSLGEQVRAIQESVARAYESSPGSPEEVVAAAVRVSGTDLSDPRQAASFWLALNSAVHGKHAREPGESVAPMAVEESGKLHAAFEAARAAAVRGKEPGEVPRETVAPDREERAKAERTEEIYRAAPEEEARILEAEMGARQDRARATGDGERLAPLSEEDVGRAAAESPRRALRRSVEGARAEEVAAERALRDEPELTRLADAEEGRKLMARAVAAQEAAERPASEALREPQRIQPRALAAAERGGVPESAGLGAKVEAGVAAVGRHFLEKVGKGDIVELAGGGTLTVASKPYVQSGRVYVRATDATGKSRPYSMRQLVALGAGTTGAREAAAQEGLSKVSSQEAPSTPIEKARRGAAARRQKRDQAIEDASAETIAAEGPTEKAAAQAKVEETMAERRVEESAQVLAERLQEKPATEPGAELPPQADPTVEGASRGPTDANNFPLSDLRPEQQRTAKIVQEIAKSGVLKALANGRKPPKGKSIRADSFAEYYSRTKERYSKLPGQLEAVPEALRDYIREGEGLPPKSEPMVVTIDRLSAKLDEIMAIEHPPAAMEALLLLQRSNVSFISGPEGILLRFSPAGVRFLNRMESLMIRLSAGGDQAGHILTMGSPEWGRLYHTLRTVWPMVHPTYWTGTDSAFHAALLDEMTRQFTRDPSGENVSKPGRWWDEFLGSPERWGGRLVAEAAKEMSLIYSKAAAVLHRTVGKNADWRKFLDAEEGRDAKVFRALDEGPEGAAWKALSPEESAMAHEVRSVMRKMWEMLEPVTRKGQYLRRRLAVTDRQIASFGKRIKVDMEARLSRAAERAAADEEIDWSSLRTPREQERALKRLHRRRDSLRQQLEKHQRHGGISEFVHHVAEERDVQLSTIVHQGAGDKRLGLPDQVMVGTMRRRRGVLQETGQLKESTLAALTDYFPQAIAYYHKNALLGRWADFLYGTERPLLVRDLFGKKSVLDFRNRVLFHEGRDWAYGGLWYVTPDGRYLPRKVQDASGKLVTNRDAPRGSQLVARLEDWENRRDPWTKSSTPAPSGQQLQRETASANRQMFREVGGRYMGLARAARRLGEGNVDAGMEKLYEAYRKGPESTEFLALPQRVRSALLRHIGYLPPHSGRVAHVPLPVIEASVTVRPDGWIERASDYRVRTVKEYLDHFAGRAAEMRLSFFRFDRTLGTIGKIANAAKIGWWNVKTAGTVITGGVFYNAAMPFHPATLMEAGTLTFQALFRWRAANKGATSLRPEDFVAGHEQSPFQAGAKAMRTPRSELDAMEPAARAKQDLIDDALEALHENPIFLGKIGEMARVMTTEGSHERIVGKMHGWRPGQEVTHGGRRYRVVDAPVKDSKRVRVRVQQVLPDGELARSRVIAEPLKEPGVLMQAIRGERGYELISAMESYIRGQSFLAGYLTGRRAGRTHEEARTLGENATLYAHGIFNQMTASAFFQSPLGPFLGGIKSYAARQLGVWMRSPNWMRMRYASMALAANALWRSVGLGDLTNVLGTAVSDLPLVGPVIDELIAQYEETVEEDEEVQSFAVEHILKPGLLGIHVPVGASPGLGLLAGGAETARELARGNWHGVLDEGFRAARKGFEPWFVSEGLKAFAATEAEPGRYRYVPVGGDRTSYTLNHSGAYQLVRSLALPGPEPEVSRQIESARLDLARKRVVEGTRADWRARFDREVALWDESEKAKTLTPTKQTSVRYRMRELLEEGAELGYDVSPVGRSALQRAARQRNRMAQYGPAQRNIVNAGNKLASVRLFESALREGSLTWKEAQEVANELRGERSFEQWVDDPRIPEETRRSFRAAYREFSAVRKAR